MLYSILIKNRGKENKKQKEDTKSGRKESMDINQARIAWMIFKEKQC